MNIQRIGNGKAVIVTDNGGSKWLSSYDTLIMSLQGNTYLRHWDGWTATTGKHIKEFAGLNKAQFNALELVEVTE